MCVKIVYPNETLPYDTAKPLEDQLQGSKQIIVNYEPKDPSIDKFLDEIERFCQTGINCNLNVKFIHNDNLMGMRAKKRGKKLQEDLNLNDLIKAMALSYSEVDRKLEALANKCLGNNCRVK